MRISYRRGYFNGDSTVSYVVQSRAGRMNKLRFLITATFLASDVSDDRRCRRTRYRSPGSFIDWQARRYNRDRKDADRRLQNASYSKYKPRGLSAPFFRPPSLSLSRPDGLAEETKGRQRNRSVCLDGEVAESQRTRRKSLRRLRVSQSASRSMDFQNVDPDTTSPFVRDIKIQSERSRHVLRVVSM